MNRPPRPASQGIDESTDAYDTIEWLVKNLPNNNGKVGTIGVSYPGWLTAGTGMGPQPGLKGNFHPGPVGQTGGGGGFFHQGGFRLAYRPEEIRGTEASTHAGEEPTASPQP